LTQKIGHFEHDPTVSMLLAIMYFMLNQYTAMIKLILRYINTDKKTQLFSTYQKSQSLKWIRMHYTCLTNRSFLPPTNVCANYGSFSHFERLRSSGKGSASILLQCRRVYCGSRKV